MKIPPSFFSKIGKTKFIGLRFFSIYGSFGRPDMLIYKILNCYEKKKIFYLNNYGNHTRDFTFIDDVVSIIDKLKQKPIKKDHEIFNISNTKKIKLTKLINLMKQYHIEPLIKKRGFQVGDIKDACGSNVKIRNFLNNQKFTSFEVGIKKTLNWYKNNKDKF